MTVVWGCLVVRAVHWILPLAKIAQLPQSPQQVANQPACVRKNKDNPAREAVHDLCTTTKTSQLGGVVSPIGLPPRQAPGGTYDCAPGGACATVVRPRRLRGGAHLYPPTLDPSFG